MIEKIEKHCYEDKNGTYTCDYDLNEIGNKLNELIEAFNTHVVPFYLRN